MTPIKRLQVANYCYALVSGMFAKFQRPDFKGPNFTWARFPEMVEELARVQIFTSVSMTNKTQVEIETTAAEYAKEIAETLIKHAGYV